MSVIQIENVQHHYGDRQALADVSFDVNEGEIFGLLGPNGSGKTTLFRILSTLMPLQSGQVTVAGFDVNKNSDNVRRRIGVTFQAPSLDIKLTVRENLTHQGHLYGLSGANLKQRIDEVLAQLKVADRQHEFAEKLSGGLKRRVEIAKCLLHHPKILLLDEPSTGLDPGARFDLWQILEDLQRQHGVTIVVTTHLMEEAERAHRLAILDLGKLIAIGTPDQLRDKVGGDNITIQADQPEAFSAQLKERLGVETQKVGGTLRIEDEHGLELLSKIATTFPGEFRSVTLGKPTLEDVFIKLTGRGLITVEDESATGKKKKH